MKITWPPDVIARYRAHFDKTRASIGDDLHSILDHFGAPSAPGAELLLERVVTWCVYVEKPLSLPERMIVGATALRSDVQNGGFHQYFVNDAGDYWEDVLYTLRAGGDADGERHLLETVRVFPDARPSADRAARNAQLEAIEARDGAAMWAHFDRQDALYYARDPDPGGYPTEETLWSALRRVPNERFIPYIEGGDS
ncbi:MAG TPA: DUF4375 domain-containing protein [Armatimonadaceae bacterium]|nr:DUF4375 domain-containing protein [Armatimonadaceae bacterium]